MVCRTATHSVPCAYSSAFLSRCTRAEANFQALLYLTARLLGCTCSNSAALRGTQALLTYHAYNVSSPNQTESRVRRFAGLRSTAIVFAMVTGLHLEGLIAQGYDFAAPNAA